MSSFNIPNFAQCLFWILRWRTTSIIKNHLFAGAGISVICLKMVFSGRKIYLWRAFRLPLILGGRTYILESVPWLSIKCCLSKPWVVWSKLLCLSRRDFLACKPEEIEGHNVHLNNISKFHFNSNPYQSRHQQKRKRNGNIQRCCGLRSWELVPWVQKNLPSPCHLSDMTPCFSSPVSLSCTTYFSGFRGNLFFQ